MTLETINPTTGQPLARYETTGSDEALAMLARAAAAQQEWRATALGERIDVVERLARRLRDEREDLAALMTSEMGKPIGESRAEVDKCAWLCDYFAAHAADVLAPRAVETDAARSYVAFRPLGVVLAIMPWNFPLWQVLRFSVPAFVAGNGGLLKHAPGTTGCALAVERLWREAGLPEDLLRALVIPADAVPTRVEALIARPEVAAVTLTGSTRAGAAVAAVAGREIKKTVLELGGSDPYVVLEDADLDAAAAACVTSRMINSGQSCIAAKRWIVVDGVRDAFTYRVLERLRELEVGDPRDEATDVGPVARADLRDNLHRQVTESVAAGAELLLGGALPDGPGFFYPPTLLADVRPGMPAFDEETFGPVAAIVPAADEAQAVGLANRTDYGLGAAVFTRDVARGERLAREQLAAGNVFVNAFVRSDPRLPFGGVKRSGYGRELAAFGLREFVNVKTVWVA